MTGHTQKRAGSMRRRSTEAERVLWQRLRARQINSRKWRRQQAIDQYVVDFLCYELRLIVEIDGDVHPFQEREDVARQSYLEAQGFQVLRFTNDDVLTNLDGLLRVIWDLTKR